LKPEWWGSPLVQEEKYQEKPVKREEIIIYFGTMVRLLGDLIILHPLNMTSRPGFASGPKL
jgi:hypothetical protein